MNNDNRSGISTLLEYVTSRDWAMEPAVLAEMAAVIERHIGGERLLPEQIEALTAPKQVKGSDDRGYEVTDDGRAIIPVSGVIAKHAAMVNGISQPRGTSVEKLTEQLMGALADRYVTSILLHVESPGGSIAGLADFAAAVREASYVKPVTAYIDDLGASAAYWIASQASAIYANQTALVGSIGVYTLYMDSSKWAEKLGVKFHILRSGEHKGVGEVGIEITQSNLDAIQGRVNTYFGMFLDAVLAGRGGAGMDAESLRGIADGRVFIGAEAVKNKLIDGITTLEALLSTAPPAVRQRGTMSERVQESADASAGFDNQFSKEKHMAEIQQKQADAVNAEEQIRSATAGERARITAIQSALASDYLGEVRTKAIAEGLSLMEAKALAFEAAVAANKKEIAALQADIAAKDEKLKAIAAGGSSITAPDASDREAGTAAGDDGRAETFTAAAANFQGQGKSKAAAMRTAAVAFPKAHKAWKKELPSIGK